VCPAEHDSSGLNRDEDILRARYRDDERDEIDRLNAAAALI
jgi:hypothetical protein